MRRYPVDLLALGIAAVAAISFATTAVRAFELTVDAPPSLEPAARRVRAIDRESLASALARAGLAEPAQIALTLIPEDDPRARRTPSWVVGRAFGDRQIEIFPQRVSSYPYDSLEAVVWHEVVHLALTSAAGGQPIPRWFHEGLAVTLESGWGVRDHVRLLVAALDRPTISDVDRLFASEASMPTAQAYVLAAALVNDVRQRHGPAIPGAIAQQVATGVPFERAFARATGETVDEAASRAWAAYRRVSRWVPALTGPSAVWVFILLLSFVAFAVQLRRRARRRRRWDEESDVDC